MTKSSEWVCADCLLSKDPCPHLEKLLPQMRDGAFPNVTDGVVNAMTMSAFETHFWSFDSSQFLELMRNYGFTDEWDLELLEAKYCRNLSAADVAKEQNYVSKDKVNRRLKQLRALLKERGFEQEDLKWEPKK